MITDATEKAFEEWAARQDSMRYDMEFDAARLAWRAACAWRAKRDVAITINWNHHDPKKGCYCNCLKAIQEDAGL